MREVESEYMREEVLENFDVSTVFVKRDAAYYEFKPAIETREQIREVAGDVDGKIIAQLERWWDKYRVSLNELDVHVAEAEKVMRGYLRELGYE